jgi:hypothetical protein
MLRLILVIFTIFFSLIPQQNASAQAENLFNVDGVLCGLVEGRWVAGQINKKGVFIRSSDKIAKLTKRIRNANGAQKLKLQLKKRKLVSRLRKQQPNCNSTGTNIPEPTRASAAPSLIVADPTPIKPSNHVH